MRTKQGNKEQDILQAAVQLFSENGYHKTRMFTIAERAGVATGSVYLYFTSKEEILNRIFHDLWKRLAAEIEILTLRLDLEPAQKLERLIDHVFDLFLNKPALALVFVNEQNHLLLNQDNAFLPYYERFLEHAEAILIEGTERGVFRKDIDLKITRLFVFGGIRFLIHQWAQDPEQISLQGICQQVKHIVQAGIQTAAPSPAMK